MTIEALPSPVRIGLARGALEVKTYFREKDAVVFTFSLPVIVARVVLPLAGPGLLAAFILAFIFNWNDVRKVFYYRDFCSNSIIKISEFDTNCPRTNNYEFFRLLWKGHRLTVTDDFFTILW